MYFRSSSLDRFQVDQNVKYSCVSDYGVSIIAWKSSVVFQIQRTVYNEKGAVSEVESHCTIKTVIYHTISTSSSQSGVMYQIRIIRFLVVIKTSSTTHVTDMPKHHSNGKHNVHYHQNNKESSCTYTDNDLTLMVIFCG